jgi:hypothetical protein
MGVIGSQNEPLTKLHVELVSLGSRREGRVLNVMADANRDVENWTDIIVLPVTCTDGNLLSKLGGAPQVSLVPQNVPVEKLIPR